MTDRNKLFISHANPEDSFLATWLASKLRLLGYDTWVDVENLSPGQYFNRDYDRVIRSEAIRFLPLMTASYVRKSTLADSGVMNELLSARTVKDMDDFVIPLNCGGCSYDDYPPGIRGRIAIDFESNWATGLSG